MKNHWSMTLFLFIYFNELFLISDGIEPYELEDFLADILDHEFDTITEDDSLNLVCIKFDYI